MTLSDQQRAAAERQSQDVCVVAGPGSGKTRVLIARICWLIEQGTPPDRILAITFTEKAANQLRSRLAEQFHGRPERAAIDRAWVSTIHGFCARLLRENAVVAGVDIDFGVLDQHQASMMLRESAEQSLDDLLAREPELMRRLLASLHVSSNPAARAPDLPDTLTSIYEAIRIAGQDLAKLRAAPDAASLSGLMDLISAVARAVEKPEEWDTDTRREKRARLLNWLASACALPSEPVTEEHFRVLSEFNPNLRGLTRPASAALQDAREVVAPRVRSGLATRHFQPLRSILVSALESLDARYRARKAALSALDFSDLEERVLALLTDKPGIMRRVQERFDHILMDELQDTNPLQWKIVDRIRRADRFFGVGDPNQSIFAFRHADPLVYRKYRDGLERNGKQIDKLTENYRSRGEILEAVGRLLQGQAGVDLERLVALRSFPDKATPSVETHVAQAETTGDAEAREAQFVARRILELSSTPGRSYSDVAVLARKTDALRPVERALKALRIPCLVVGGRTLLEGREALDLTLAIGAIASTENEISLAGVLRSPLVGVSDETLLRLKQGGDLWTSIARLDAEAPDLDPEDAERLVWFRHLLEELRAIRDTTSPDVLLSRWLDESSYEEGIEEHRRANIEKFLALVRDLWERDRLSPAELLGSLRALRGAEAEAEAPPAEAANAVRLMSIHSAKGLEFPVVSIVAMHQGVAGDVAPICYSSKGGFGVRWRDPTTAKAAPDAVHAAVTEEQKAARAEEEMRLLYVAMTRAEDHLILSYASTERSRGSSWSALIERRLPPAPVPAGAPAVAEPRPSEAPADDSPEAILKPPVSGQHDSSAPVTDIGIFVACPRRYYLSGYLGFSERPTSSEPETSAATIGAEVHKLLAGAAPGQCSAEIRELAEAFSRTPLAGRLDRADRIEREFGFRVEVEDVVLRGQIDLWFEEAGELVLVDYKTDRAPGERLEPHSLQLRLYALALERLTGRLPDLAVLSFLRTEREVQVSLGEDSLTSARNTVRKFREAQEAMEFPPQEGDHCRGCGFHAGMCPVGR